MGAFRAWLDLADKPEYDSRDLHTAAKFRPDVELCYDNRCAGRDAAKADPEWNGLWKWEVPEFTPEPKVPGRG